MSRPHHCARFGRHGATARQRPHRCGYLMRIHRTMAATVATLLILALASTPGCSASALLPHRQRQLLQGSREGCGVRWPACSINAAAFRCCMSDAACARVFGPSDPFQRAVMALSHTKFEVIQQCLLQPQPWSSPSTARAAA